MNHKELLKMIEIVDPVDYMRMMDIDLAVAKYITGYKHYRQGTGYPIAPPVSNSRDVLKSIRPEGWVFHIDATAPQCLIDFEISKGPDVAFLGRAKTEELAELHAIIQAIAYERGEKC